MFVRDIKPPPPNKHTSGVSQLKAGSVFRCQSDLIQANKQTIYSQLHTGIVEVLLLIRNVTEL